MKNTIQIIGENIQRFREARGWTRTFLAEQLGLDQSFVSRIEKGKGSTVDTLDKLATVLEVETYELLKPYTVEDMSILDKFKKMEELPELKQEMVKQMIDAFLKEAESN